MTKEEFYNLEVGKSFACGNKNVRVKKVGYTECDYCLFEKVATCLTLQELSIIPYCYAGDREDGNNIIFEEVENDK